MFDRRPGVEQIAAADQVAETADAERGHDLADLFGDEEEIIDHMLRLSGETLAQVRILGGDADRAGIEMTFAHHDAAGGDQRRGGEAEFVGPQQRPDHHVAPGPQTAVDLHGDPAAQLVQDQGLMGFGQADLPRPAGMLDRGQRRGAVPPSWPEMVTWSARALETPAATVPTPVSETSLTLIRAAGLTFLRSKIS